MISDEVYNLVILIAVICIACIHCGIFYCFVSMVRSRFSAVTIYAEDEAHPFIRDDGSIESSDH
jgi:hypothetical protein